MWSLQPSGVENPYGVVDELAHRRRPTGRRGTAPVTEESRRHEIVTRTEQRPYRVPDTRRHPEPVQEDERFVTGARHDLEPGTLDARDQETTTATGVPPLVRVARCDTAAAHNWA